MYRTKISLNTKYSFIIKNLNLKFTVPTYWIKGGSEFLNDPSFKNLLNNIGEKELILVDISEDPLNFSIQNTLIKDKRIIIIAANPLYSYEFAAQNSSLKKICPYKTIFFNILFNKAKESYKVDTFLSITPHDKAPKRNLELRYFLLSARRDTFYRQLCNYFLHKANLFDKGYIAHNRIFEGSVDPLYLEIHKNNLPGYDINNRYALRKHFLDDEPRGLWNKGFAATDFGFYKSYLDYFQFEVVPETVLYSSSLFLSEKVFKPILFKKPFLVLSSIHTLSYLRKLGFKTFDPVIDESYDFETDNVIRTLKVLQEVKKLCSMSHIMLRKKLDQLDEILEYNHNHFMSTDWHFNIQTKVQKYINENITNR
tara:strand:+ start:1147 stop:2250 length:1104 start_codon:yes stop_codon:yes gene_type:complete